MKIPYLRTQFFMSIYAKVKPEKTLLKVSIENFFYQSFHLRGEGNNSKSTLGNKSHSCILSFDVII